MVVLSIQNYIGGNFQAPIVDNKDDNDGGTSRRSLPVTNPATGEVLATVCVSSTGDVDAAVHAAATALYQNDVTTGWLEPGVRRWFVNWRFPDPAARLRFDRSLNERFDLANLRADVAADFSDANDAADFARDLPTSVLPLMTAVPASVVTTPVATTTLRMVLLLKSAT